MKSRDDFDLTQLRKMFAELPDSEVYEVLSAYFWATRHARAHAKGKPDA
jgi:hypothetical protein